MPPLWQINLAMALALVFWFTINFLVMNGMGTVVFFAGNLSASIYLGVKIADAVGWLADEMDPPGEPHKHRGEVLGALIGKRLR
jgi:hypothetical protein